MIRHILVVCVGNICRSPMAEAVLRDSLNGKTDITVESAGLGALVDKPASEYAVELLKERDIDISTHRARQLTQKLIGKADLVLVMEASHKRVIGANEPTARGKVHRLGKWRDLDIPDPYRMPRDIFEDTLDMIDGGVADWVERLIELKDKSDL